MVDENKEFETWEEVIIDFFMYKVSSIKSGQKCKLFHARDYVGKKEKEIDKEKDEKKRNRFIVAKDNQEKELAALKKDAIGTEIKEWIDLTIKKKKPSVGKKIIKTTHVLKFTHGSADSSGLLLNSKSDDLLLSTSSFKRDLVIDIAHNNGALVTISRFLNLSINGERIIDLILNGQFDFLKPFNLNSSTLKDWSDGFSEFVEEREIRTADKAKQTYFPMDCSKKNIPYHLIVPLFASSLANEIDSTITDLKYGRKQKEVRDCMKVAKNGCRMYHESGCVGFPNLAIQNFGGLHPKNISMLNADRGGKIFLFSTQPPTWKNHLKPPVYKKSLFDENFFYQNINEDIDYLRDFLLRFKRIDMSVKYPERRKWIDRWLSNIIDELLFFVGNIQSLSPGWSAAEDIKLKPSHQYLLDPYRKDEAFQSARNAIDWQTVICADFAHWLNRRLIGKDKQFTPQPEHRRMWILLLEQPLREHSEMLDMELKFQGKVKT